MIRDVVLFAAATMLASGVALGQEPVGAGRIELESALFGGGAIYMPTPGSQSTGYVLTVGATTNVNRWAGIEGDFAWAMSRKQALSLYGVAPLDRVTPSMIFYTGNIVVSPGGHHHRFVPYAEVGAGAMTVLGNPEGAFGLAADTTHLAVNIGGGARWFPLPHWGVRGDYRYIGIRNSNPPVGVTPIRHANRVYGALVLTF